MPNSTDTLKIKMQNSQNKLFKEVSKECVALVLNEGADPMAHDHGLLERNTLLHNLIKFYSIDASASIYEDIKTLLNKHPDCVKALNGSGITPLQYLMNSFSNQHISPEDFKKLSLLLVDKGADPTLLSTTLSLSHSSLLHFYINTNVKKINDEAIKTLLEKKPSRDLVNVKDNNGKTPLHVLLNKYHNLSDQDFNHNVMILVRANANIDISDNSLEANTLIHYLINTNFNNSNYEVIEDLLKHRPECIKAKNGNQVTPLQYLMNSFINRRTSPEHFKKLALLLAKQKDADLTVLSTTMSKTGRSLLQLLMEIGLNGEHDSEITQLIALNSNLINLPNGTGRPPLQAILYENSHLSAAFVKKAKEWGANLFYKTSVDETLLHSACHSGNLECAKYLLTEGLDLFAKINTGQSMLHYCFANHNESLWQWLINNGVNINAQDTIAGYTPLHYAVCTTNTTMAKWLLAHNARVDLVDKEGMTAPMLATKHRTHHLLFANNTAANTPEAQINPLPRPYNSAQTRPPIPNSLPTIPVNSQIITQAPNEPSPVSQFSPSPIIAVGSKEQNSTIVLNDNPNAPPQQPAIQPIPEDKASAKSRIFKENLLKAIQEMHKYGTFLKSHKLKKGEVAVNLATLLKSKTEAFYANTTEMTLNQFKQEFETLLNSKNHLMSEYRVSWSTIIKNIAIALTGIGSLAILGQLIYSKATQGRALFFFQEKSTTCEKKADAIKSCLTSEQNPEPTTVSHTLSS